MKKSKMLLGSLCIMAISFCFMGCGAKKAEAQSACETQSTAEDTNENSDKEYICGEFTLSDDTEVKDEIKELMEKALADSTGVNYDPIAYLGSQVVAGTNHAILCKATIVYQNTTPYYTIMYINEDLDGNVSILGYSDIELGDYK